MLGGMEIATGGQERNLMSFLVNFRANIKIHGKDFHIKKYVLCVKIKKDFAEKFKGTIIESDLHKTRYFHILSTVLFFRLNATELNCRFGIKIRMCNKYEERCNKRITNKNILVQN